LVTPSSGLPSECSSGAESRSRSRSFGDSDPAKTSLDDASSCLPFVFGCQSASRRPSPPPGTRVPG